MNWMNILKSEVYDEDDYTDGELQIYWESKDGIANGEAFYSGYWGILMFGHGGERNQGLGEKYLKEMIDYLHSIEEGEIEADGTLPHADGFWDKMLSRNIIQSIRRRGQ